jgi:hypothetical protein
MTDLITRLLALAEKAVDEALQFEYGDPEDRYIYRELQELRQLVQQPVERPTDEEIDEWQSHCAYLTRSVEAGGAGTGEHWWAFDVQSDHVADIVRAALARWTPPAIEPVPVSERLPGPEDCDDSYQCWQWDTRSDSWTLYTSIGLRLNPLSTHWLPYHALPLPTK